MRSFMLSGACAASMMLALTPIASAADIDAVPEPAGMGWYVSVFGGWSMPDDFDAAYASSTGSTAVTSDISVNIDNGFMAGLAVGAHFNEWLRGEVELSGHWHDADGAAAVTSITGLPTTPVTVVAAYGLDGDVDAVFLLANLWVDLPVGEVIRPYFGGGVGIGRLSVDLSATPTTGPAFSAIDDDDWAFAYQLGAGIAVAFTPNMAIDVGYRYTVINNAELETTAGLGGFEFEADYKSHNVLVGLRFGF